MGASRENAPRIKDCPAEVLRLLRADLRRAFLNVTFTASSQGEEDEKLSAILARCRGGAYGSYDADDGDNELQVTASDGKGDKKKFVTFIYNQTAQGGWELAAVLLGTFPVGAPSLKHDGWRDITTREPVLGQPSTDLMRTYRRKNGVYTQISESVESGG